VSTHVLVLSCPDQPGLVAAVSAQIVSCGGNILESSQYGDPESGLFFMRVALALADPAAEDRLAAGFEALASRHAMQLTLRRADRRPRVLILVSRFDHCLVDLLYRQRIGELDTAVVGIVSNHADAVADADRGAIPFHHLPVTAATRAAQEARILQLVEETGAELVVLARYMQILSDDMARALSGRCINIHHSFLPGF
jgi:formyltetrahydrofolate deformylase